MVNSPKKRPYLLGGYLRFPWISSRMYEHLGKCSINNHSLPSPYLLSWLWNQKKCSGLSFYLFIVSWLFHRFPSLKKLQFQPKIQQFESLGYVVIGAPICKPWSERPFGRGGTYVARSLGDNNDHHGYSPLMLHHGMILQVGEFQLCMIK